MHIRDIRIGMKLVFGQEKLRMTMGKAYEVLDIREAHAGEFAIVDVTDDRGEKRGFYARRFEKVAEDAPEAPQPAAVGVPVAPYVPKVGDRVRLAFKPENENEQPGWVKHVMDKFLDEQTILTIKRIQAGAGWVKVEEDEHDFSYNPKWLELVQEGAPARPFVVGDIVNQKAAPERNQYKVLALLDNSMIRISRGDDHDMPLGMWKEDLFQLVRRGNGEAVAPKPAIINFLIGNCVKVVKKHNGEAKLKWADEMEASIGNVYKIERFDDWAKSYQLSNGWSYLAESLELAKEEDMAKNKKVAKKKQPSLRDLIAESRKKDIKNVGGVSSYVIFVKDVKTGEITLNRHLKDVCHARLTIYYGGHADKKEAVAVIDYQQAHEKQIPKGYEKTYRKFVDYIVNRSPWRIAFQGKTVKNVLENGVLMNVEAPSGAVAGACQALRYLSEFNGQNAVWKLMMDNGIQEDAAFLTTYAFISEGGDKFTQHPMGGGHQPINGMIAAGNLISFFANGYDEVFLKSEPYRTKTSYRVHEHVEAVKDVLNLPKQYSHYVNDSTEWTEKKEAWACVKYATEEQVLAFARHLEQLINKAREAKAAK